LIETRQARTETVDLAALRRILTGIGVRQRVEIRIDNQS
jgi:hypothetical protein